MPPTPPDALADLRRRLGHEDDLAAVYMAESMFYDDLDLEDDDLPDWLMTVDEASAFSLSMLVAAGFKLDEAPAITIDVADDEEVDGYLIAGTYRPATDTIHLHPRCVTRRVLLHELAHWMRPHVGHGPQFCGALIRLVGIAFGTDARDELAWRFGSNRIEFCPRWAEMTDDDLARVDAWLALLRVPS